MSQFWSDVVHRLTPYTPGEQPKIPDLIKLNTNENPYGPSPKVLEALKLEATDALRLYPDPNSDSLKTLIAENYHLKADQVFVGNGSDEVLAHVFQALLKHNKPLLFPDISYSFYPVYCALYAIDYQTIALNKNFEIDVNDYTQENGGIIFPNPNAPTGIPLARSNIEHLLKVNSKSVVVIDEAYVDFGTQSAVQLIDSYPNLLVTHTLSKARSLAGLRVGYALGNATLIEALTRVKDSFNSYPIDRFAEAGAIASFKDSAYFSETTTKVIATREWLVAAMQDLNFDVLPSGANFIFAKHKTFDGVAIAERLRHDRIIVRHFKKPQRVSPYIRITIGTQPQSVALIQSLVNILKSLN